MSLRVLYHDVSIVLPTSRRLLEDLSVFVRFSSAGSKVKQSRKEKEAELAEVIAELALQVEIKGSCRKPTWRDQPVVLLAMLPVHTAT